MMKKSIFTFLLNCLFLLTLPAHGNSFTTRLMNNPPIANDDYVTTSKDTPIDFDLLGNDSDPDGDDININTTPISSPTNGTVVINPDGTASYTPDPGFCGLDFFEYQICDAVVPALCSTALVTIELSNCAPVANDDSATTDEETAVTIPVLGNDSDPNGDIDPGSIVIVSPPENGTVEVDPITGDITYLPAADFFGQDSFLYEVCDDELPPLCDTGVVTIEVTPVNDPPIATDDSACTTMDTPIAIDVINNDWDIEDSLNPCNVTVVEQADNGTVTFGPAPTCDLIYTPDPSFLGTDTFEYQICDESGFCDFAVVTIEVKSGNGNGPICTTFESSGLEGWTELASTIYLATPSLDGTTYLRIEDESGASWTYNNTSYPNDWANLPESCLCFDYKIFNDGLSSIENLNPKITIYQGANPNSAAYIATFVGDITITENDDWVRVCAPIELNDGVSMPRNEEGQWVMTDPGGWNTLLSNVSGVSFWVDITSAQTEIFGVDNICIDECPKPPVDSSIYCCDLPNMIENGNFEQGNTGFSTDYSFATAPTPSQYSITNAGAAAALCSNWLVDDPSTCINGANGSFMLVNGLTAQASNTSNVIWEQTLTTEVDSMYRFCAKFKDLPTCCQNGQPTVQISFSSAGGIGWTTISTDAANPCDWQELAFDFTAGSTTETIRILLDQTPLADGNDVAIDDIGLFKKEKPSLNISLNHDGRNDKVTASIHDLASTDDALPSEECQYYWIVGEVSNVSPLTISSAMVGNSAMGWGLTTTFPGFNGGGADGIFNDEILYLVYLVVNNCDCYADAFTYQITYDFVGKTEQMPYEFEPKELEKLKADVEQYIQNEIFIESGGKAIGNPSSPNVISLASKETPTQSNWSIHPNPTTDRVQVTFHEYKEQGLLTLFDVNGIAIKTIKKEANAQSIDLTMNDLPAAVYLLQFDYQGKTISKRIVKH